MQRSNSRARDLSQGLPPIRGGRHRTRQHHGDHCCSLQGIAFLRLLARTIVAIVLRGDGWPAGHNARDHTMSKAWTRSWSLCGATSHHGG
jgi:hypothetical protein